MPTYKNKVLRVFWDKCVNEAINALSLMIGKNVSLTGSSVQIELLNNIPKLMSPKEISTTLVYTKVTDHMNSVIITSSSLRHFLSLIDILLKKKISYSEALNEENKSSVVELGEIINGYFVSSLNNLFDTKFVHERSELSVNPYRAVEYFDFGNLYVEKINVLTFESKFKVADENIEGKIILLTEENKIDTLMEMISQKIKIA